MRAESASVHERDSVVDERRVPLEFFIGQRFH